jgi:hypothetical protein
MAEINPKIKEIIEQFNDYLESEEAKKHLQIMEDEKGEVREVMQKLSQLNTTSKEFTDLVLYGLLPYSKTTVAKRVSLFPAFMNIRQFFSAYKYSEEEWNLIANKIYSLCNNFKDFPNKLSEYVAEFTKDKYSRRLQCGSLTPILYCLNDAYPIINNRTIRSFRSISLIFDDKNQLSQKLDDYIDNMEKINALIDKIGFDLLTNHNYQDLFFYWYDSEILSEERKIKKDESEEEEDAVETEEEVKVEQVHIPSFVEKLDIDSGFDFKPHSLGDPQRIKINQIISQISKTKWVLPHFQRYFDWDKTNVKEFWDSIFNDYYVGSFLLWETDRNPELGIQPILGIVKNEDDLKPESIILDGQQRITSLYYAIKAPKFSLRGSKIPLFYYINFNLFFNKSSANGVVEVHAKKFSKQETFERVLFPLYELETYDAWVNDFEDFLLKQSSDKDKVRKIRRIIDKKLRHIWEGFEIPYVALPESMELAQVTDIFEKINTKGKLLSVFDLLIARLYKNNIELRKIWDATVKDYPNISRYSKTVSKTPIYVLQAMSLLHEKTSSTKRADILDIYKKVYESSDRDFEEDWTETTDLMNRAIEKLENMRDGFGVKDEKELPFAPMIPVITALLKIIEERDNKVECYKKLNKWYWSAVFTNAYSSAADSQMTQDYKEVKTWFDNDTEVPKTVIQLTREMTTMDLREIQSKSNAKYKGIMSLLALEGAKDFDTSQALENARGNDKDHLFPKSFIFGFGSNKYINSILNMSWMSEDTNRKIKRFKKPSVYVPEFVKEKYHSEEEFKTILRTHLISEKGYDCFLSDNFESFITEREKTFKDKLKNILEISELESQNTLISPESPFSNKIIFINTLKSCSDYIYWVDKYFSQLGLELLSKSVENENIKDIKIIMAIDKANETFRDLFKDFKEEMKNKGITCELRVIIDAKKKALIHDRFIISKYDSYNIPSPDIIARGQLSEISKSQNKTKLSEEFEKLWTGSKDIIYDWNTIKENIKKE